ncbi:hypothetical protein LTR17_010304 [Elasticomyces elasticus]|nr:hypothetical protein LTR17_010304 [Elasticomyces elasticus]
MTTSIRPAIMTTTMATYSTPSTTSSAVTMTARNHIDESDAINIVFGVLALVVAIFALFVGIYYGRQQALRLAGAWGHLHWPRLMTRRTTVAGPEVPLARLDHSGLPQIHSQHIVGRAGPSQRDSAIDMMV